MHEAGWSYNQLARVFEMSKTGIAKIVTCARRAEVSMLAN